MDRLYAVLPAVQGERGGSAEHARYERREPSDSERQPEAREEVADREVAGEDVVVESGQIGNGDAFTLRGGQWLKVKMLPSESSYAVAEDSTAGFTLVSASGSEGTIRAGSTQSAVFTNDYAAAGSQSFSLQKTLEGRQMSRYQFRFELVDKTPDSETFDQVIRTASADAAGYAEFSRVSYNGADHGKDFTYEIVRSTAASPATSTTRRPSSSRSTSKTTATAP